MTDKERYEMMNLRKRVEAQRAEIKRLVADIALLREELTKWVKVPETD